MAMKILVDESPCSKPECPFSVLRHTSLGFDEHFNRLGLMYYDCTISKRECDLSGGVCSGLKVTVAYLCDGKACGECLTGDARYCHHTFDIRHAVNFTEIEPGKFMEKE